VDVKNQIPKQCDDYFWLIGAALQSFFHPNFTLVFVSYT